MQLASRLSCMALSALPRLRARLPWPAASRLCCPAAFVPQASRGSAAAATAPAAAETTQPQGRSRKKSTADAAGAGDGVSSSSSSQPSSSTEGLAAGGVAPADGAAGAAAGGAANQSTSKRRRAKKAAPPPAPVVEAPAAAGGRAVAVPSQKAADVADEAAAAAAAAKAPALPTAAGSPGPLSCEGSAAAAAGPSNTLQEGPAFIPASPEPPASGQTQAAEAATPPPAAAATPAAAAAASSCILPDQLELPASISFPDASYGLRPYQRKAIQTVVGSWKGGCNGQMVSLPTGTGKTIIFSSLLRLLAEQQQRAAAAAGVAPKFRALVLAHRQELLQQAMSKLTDIVWPGAHVTKVNAFTKDFSGQVVVASVHTAINYIPQLQEQDFDVVVVDEAHHLVMTTYDELLTALGFLSRPKPATSSLDNFSISLLSDTDSNDSDAEESASSSSSSSSGMVRAWLEPEDADGDDHDDNVVLEMRLEELQQPAATRGPEDPSKLLIGFTATPYRRRAKDSQALLEMLQLVYCRTIASMVKQGHLCNVRAKRVLTGTDLKGVRTMMGEFHTGELSEMVNSPSRNHLVLTAYLRDAAEVRPEDEASSASSSSASSSDSSSSGIGSGDGRAAATASEAAGPEANALEAALAALAAEAQGTDREEQWRNERRALAGRVEPKRKAIAFAVDIAHAEALYEVFSEAGIATEVVHSNLHPTHRRRVLQDFRDGKVAVLVNCEILTEGFDEPAVDCILMTRPTRSSGLYTQMMGRGLRICPGKKDLLLIDFTDEVHNPNKLLDFTKVVPPPDDSLLHRKPPPDKGPATVDTTALQDGEWDVLALEGPRPKTFDSSAFMWASSGRHWCLQVWSSARANDKFELWLIHQATAAAWEGRQQQGRQPAAAAAGAGPAEARAAGAAEEAKAAAGAKPGEAAAAAGTAAAATAAAAEGSSDDPAACKAKSDEAAAAREAQQPAEQLTGAIAAAAVEAMRAAAEAAAVAAAAADGSPFPSPSSSDEAAEEWLGNELYLPAVRRARGSGKARAFKPLSRNPLPELDALAVAEAYLARQPINPAVMQKDARWRQKPASGKQLDFARSLVKDLQAAVGEEALPKSATAVHKNLVADEINKLIDKLKLWPATDGQRQELLDAAVEWREPLTALEARRMLGKAKKKAAENAAEEAESKA